MSVADDLFPTQFGDIKFPSELTHLRMQFRNHVHEYPHTPLGKPEKLGAGLIRISVLGQFHTTFSKYPALYPRGMRELFSYAQNGATLAFVHPSAGSFPAFITDWDQAKSARVRSGESVEITFLQDPPNFTIADISADSSSQGSVNSSAAAWEFAVANAKLTMQGLSSTTLDLFSGLSALLNEVVGIKDQAKLYGNLYSAKLQGILNLCQQIDHRIDLQDQRAWPTIDALRTLQGSSVDALNNVQQATQSLLTYTVPFTQPLAQVAVTLFGDASESGGLLSLNGARIIDPMRVPASTPIRYYPPTPQQRAAVAA